MPEGNEKLAVFSTDTDPRYASLVPLTAYLWKQQIGWGSLVHFVGEVDPFIVQKTIEAGARVRRCTRILPGFTGARLAQNIRLFVALDDRLEKDCYLLMTDADMWPLSRTYFNDSQDWSKDLHLFNALGMDPGESEYPMCYIGATVAVWRQVVGQVSLQDSHRWRDQPLATKLIQEWSGYPGQIQKMSRSLDPRFPGFHMRYSDRLDKVEWRDLRRGDVDAHVLRPTSLDDWRRLEMLLVQMGRADEWTRDYIREICRG